MFWSLEPVIMTSRSHDILFYSTADLKTGRLFDRPDLIRWALKSSDFLSFFFFLLLASNSGRLKAKKKKKKRIQCALAAMKMDAGVLEILRKTLNWQAPKKQEAGLSSARNYILSTIGMTLKADSSHKSPDTSPVHGQLDFGLIRPWADNLVNQTRLLTHRTMRW